MYVCKHHLLHSFKLHTQPNLQTKLTTKSFLDHFEYGLKIDYLHTYVQNIHIYISVKRWLLNLLRVNTEQGSYDNLTDIILKKLFNSSKIQS
jgi:ADP-glucose pyrophosphorylase